MSDTNDKEAITDVAESHIVEDGVKELTEQIQDIPSVVIPEVPPTKGKQISKKRALVDAIQVKQRDNMHQVSTSGELDVMNFKMLEDLFRNIEVIDDEKKRDLIAAMESVRNPIPLKDVKKTRKPPTAKAATTTPAQPLQTPPPSDGNKPQPPLPQPTQGGFAKKGGFPKPYVSF